MKILHIDDERPIREVVAAVLTGYHEVTSAASLVEGHQRLETEQFDLVICDRTLQFRNDGFGYAKRLHREGFKVILLCGNPPDGAPFPCANKVNCTSREALQELINAA